MLRPPRTKERYWLRLMLAYGAVVFLTLIGLASVESAYLSRSSQEANDSLALAVAQMVRRSTSEVAFSGKYRTRLLVEQLARDSKDISYIIVLEPDGRVFAHSDPAQNDTLVGDATARAALSLLDSGDELLLQRGPLVGSAVIEVDLPFQRGYERAVGGVVRVGFDQGRGQGYVLREYRTLALLVALFALISVPLLVAISRRFDAPMQRMADTLRGILDHAPVAILIHDREGRIQQASARNQELFGVPAEALVGRQIDDVLRPLPTDYTEPAPLPPDATLNQEVLVAGGTGPRTMMLSRFSLAESSGSDLMTLALDVTEAHDLRQQLHHSQKMEAIGHLAGGVAHDFNNLLTAIGGYGELALMDSEQDTELHDNLEALLEATQKASTLTSSLLAFSRKQVIAPRPTDLLAIVRSAMGLARRVLSERIELVVLDELEAPLTVQADSGRIEQVLLNLATNARDAMRGCGTLTVTVRQLRVAPGDAALEAAGIAPGDYGVIEVKDTGHGMDPETLAAVFDPFFTTKERGRGTGLGLSTAFGILKQHAGGIRASSAVGEGASFEILLPCVDLPPDDAEISVIRRLPIDQLRGQGNVLVVEDEAGVRGYLAKLLSRAGYTVTTAADGVEGLERFRAGQDSFDLVLLDVVMPRMDGWQTHQHISELRPDMPILFISGYTADIIHRSGVLDPELNYLSKPVDHATLLRKVQRLLR